MFGERLVLAEQYAGLLATTGVSHGLIGPREIPRIWDRHILNCAVVQELIPAGSRVIDVGSGAGLPGLAVAIARPDLQLLLVEPMLRRTTWLASAIGELGLTNVRVHRGRAESLWGAETAPVVTARAVARLDELAAWCLPLVSSHGVLLALKGSSAHDEVAAAADVLHSLGATSSDVVHVGATVLPEPTTVVCVQMGDVPEPRLHDTQGRPRKVSRAARRTR